MLYQAVISGHVGENGVQVVIAEKGMTAGDGVSEVGSAKGNMAEAKQLKGEKEAEKEVGGEERERANQNTTFVVAENLEGEKLPITVEVAGTGEGNKIYGDGMCANLHPHPPTPPPPATSKEAQDLEVSQAGEKSRQTLSEAGDISAEEKNDDLHDNDEGTERAERRREQLADVHRHMAKLYITVLQVKHNQKAMGDDVEDGASALRSGEDGNESEVVREGAQGGFEGLVGLGELPLCDPFAVRGDFESVREVFKKAKVTCVCMRVRYLFGC